MLHLLHQFGDSFASFVACGEVMEPFAEKGVEGGVSGPGLLAGELDGALIGTEGDVFHYTKVVRTAFVVKSGRGPVVADGAGVVSAVLEAAGLVEQVEVAGLGVVQSESKNDISGTMAKGRAEMGMLPD